MKCRRSLRFRLIISFISFGVLLAALYGSLVYFGLHLLEDRILSQHMKMEAGHFLEKYRENPAIPMLHSRFIDSYTDPAGIPAALRPKIENLADGRYELYAPPPRHQEYHVLIQALPQSSQRLYLVYNVTALEPLEHLEPVLIGLLLGTALLVAVLGIWLGTVTARRIIAPLVELAKMTEAFEPDKLPHGFSQKFQHDEVGSLAQTLEHALSRVHAFIERERRFTRNASHELRTPLTVMKGAAELMRSLPQTTQNNLQRPLGRIERAVQSMETIITTFLCLAREQNHNNDTGSCLLRDVVKESVERHRHLLQHKPLEVTEQVEENFSIPVSSAIVSIVVGNLISNAFQYTDQGYVGIYSKADCLYVKDSGVGIAPELLEKARQAYVRGNSGEGYGLGLNIVQELCERFGWHFSLKAEMEGGTCACLCFRPNKNKLKKQDI